jgi:hypothetical protein
MLKMPFMLTTHPYGDGGEVGGVNGASVEWFRQWPSTGGRPLTGIVMEVFGKRVKAANSLLLVTETHTNRLRDIQHIRDITPAVRIVNGR